MKRNDQFNQNEKELYLEYDYLKSHYLLFISIIVTLMIAFQALWKANYTITSLVIGYTIVLFAFILFIIEYQVSKAYYTLKKAYKKNK